MQPPVSYPGNQPDSAYGGAGYGGAYAAPSGGAGAPYGGAYGTSTAGYPPQSAYGAPDGWVYGSPYEGGAASALPAYPVLATMPSSQELAEARMVPEHLAPAYGVSMVEAYKRFFRRAFTFSGYASRSEFWWATLVNVLIGILLIAPMGTLLSIDGGAGTSAESVAVVFAALLMIFHFVILVPGISLYIRRLHDTGRPGLWLLLVLVPFGRIILIIMACLDSRPDQWRPEWSR